MIYSAGQDYADRLQLVIVSPMPTSEPPPSALQRIADAHIVGKAIFTDREADRLNYPELAALDIRLSVGRRRPSEPC